MFGDDLFNEEVPSLSLGSNILFSWGFFCPFVYFQAVIFNSMVGMMDAFIA